MDEDDKAKDIKKIKETLEEGGLPEEAKKAALEEMERLKEFNDHHNSKK
jgi:transcriptional antiterminator